MAHQIDSTGMTFSDGEIVCESFMTPYWDERVKFFSKAGIKPPRKNGKADQALLCVGKSLKAGCDWLLVGRIHANLPINGMSALRLKNGNSKIFRCDRGIVQEGIDYEWETFDRSSARIWGLNEATILEKYGPDFEDM